MSHRCHAIDCKTEILPKLFMCLQHWKMVPKGMQKEIWINYRKGQEVTKQISLKYYDATQRAIEAVYNKEKK